MNKEIDAIIKTVKPLVSTPKEYIDALNDTYDKGESDFSVTQILGPPRRSALVAQHGSPNESPERLWPAFLGTCMHERLETYFTFEYGGFAERRLYVDIDGWKLGGQLDRYDYMNESGTDGMVSDYKLMANQQFTAKPNHYAQIQINAFLANENGFPTSKCRLLYADKSWSITRAMMSKEYPSSPWSSFIFEYDHKLASELARTRTLEHANAVHHGKIRDCTDDEMWKDDDKWAVRGAKAKRARKLCDSEEEAKKIAKASEVIEHRPSQRTFCTSFCGVKAHCLQYKRQS